VPKRNLECVIVGERLTYTRTHCDLAARCPARDRKSRSRPAKLPRSWLARIVGAAIGTLKELPSPTMPAAQYCGPSARSSRAVNACIWGGTLRRSSCGSSNMSARGFICRSRAQQIVECGRGRGHVEDIERRQRARQSRHAHVNSGSSVDQITLPSAATRRNVAARPGDGGKVVDRTRPSPQPVSQPERIAFQAA